MRHDVPAYDFFGWFEIPLHHGWGIEQLAVLVALSVFTAICYDILPFLSRRARKRARQHGVTAIALNPVEIFFEEQFVFWCGKHHWVMYPCMIFSVGYDNWFWTLVFVDGIMAFVSGVTVVRAIIRDRRAVRELAWALE